MKREAKHFWLGLIMAIAGSICPAQIAGADASMGGRKSKPLSPALAASVPSVMAALKAKSIYLIDVRLPADFEQYRIPGSLNIAPHAIKTKTFLKSKPIVLVNEGFALEQLSETCEGLDRAGFKAAIMAGGLLAWKEKGGPLVGDPFAIQGLNAVTPQLLSQEAGSAHLLIVDAAGPDTPSSGPGLPNAKTIRLMDNPKGLAQLKTLLGSKSADPFMRVLISAENSQANDRIQRQLAKAGIRQVYFLENGWEAYTRFNNDRLLAGRPREARKVTTGACKTCTPEEN